MKPNNKPERCPTGIAGLDDILGGGFIRGRTILVSGVCGTGKSIFGMQFLLNGILEHEEPGVYVTLEQNPVHLREDMASIGFDVEELERQGMLVIIDASMSHRGDSPTFNTREAIPHSSFSLLPEEFNLLNVVDIIGKVADKVRAKRVVVDSLSALDNMLSEKIDVRKATLDLNYKLQDTGLTSILISDIINEQVLSRHGVAEYISDGAITLHYRASGPDAGRFLLVNKMRATSHKEGIHPIRFKEGMGIEVLEA
ncbi:MAG: ATPase domain-containing protein [Candidatus Altiarchaeota archaeon]